MARPRCSLNDVLGETCRKQRRTSSPYCSLKCKNRFHYVKNKKKDEELKPKRPQDSTARGKYYNDFVKEYGEALVDKLYTHQQVADKIGVSRSLVTKMYIAYLEDKENFEAQKTWKTPLAAKKSLKDFKDFRDRYFRTETGEKYETADFHENWINHIVQAIEDGGQQMILSPPRHGKTDLLTHFAVWQI